MSKYGLLRIALLTLMVLLVQGTWVLAGTTGNVQGRVTDTNGNAIAGARVTTASPSQSRTVTSGANGFYSVLDLSPDTYSVTGSKDGYDPATVYGITVQADQISRANLELRPTTKVLGRVTTTATASVVSRTVTGDLYAVNAQAIQSYQGSAGGAETLYSQNGVVGSLPGVVRASTGTGGGYGGQGQLSLRGGSFDQVGYELDGVPLNRGFDFYNGTAFLTNGLSSLEVYTGGAPADAGRAMSGYINEVIQRGKYPGGADFTGVVGSPVFNHTINADVYGGTPDNKFTYYVSTLAVNSDYNFGDRSNLAGVSFTVPANDPGCGAFNLLTPHNTPGPPLNCGVANVLGVPESLAAYGSLPFSAERDTVGNFHWALQHNGLNDDVQGLYLTGATASRPYGLYGTPGSDPAISTGTSSTNVNANNQIIWPIGNFYYGAVGQPYNPALFTPLTWPTSGGSLGVMPPNFEDSQSTQYSISKLAYTRAISQSSFLRIYGYTMYSAWTLDQPINGIVGGTFYQLHDHLTGYTLNYQNQLNSQNLLKLDADYSRDLTLRYNYGNAFSNTEPFFPPGGVPNPFCTGFVACTPGANVVQIEAPFAYVSTTTPVDYDAVLADSFKPSDKLLFDLGVRWDEFRYELMPGMQITGLNGLAYQAEEHDGQCLNGYNYSPSDPAILGPTGTSNCFALLGPASPTNLDGVGAANWTDPPGFIAFTDISPRFGFTYTLDTRNVIRFSVGRYVQPPNSAFEEYRENPVWGPGDTVSLLNHFYDGLGFLVVHNVKPEDSTNYDLSFEHEFSGGMSMKLTPYYRNTRNQVLNLPVNPASPSFVTGFNFGNARIKGVEFLLRQNVRSANGIGGTLAATYTDSTIRFGKGPQGTSFVDILNGVGANGTCQGFGICGYNAKWGTNYALLDPNAYYPPSFVQSAAASPSYDVKWVVNLTLDGRMNGFDILPTFNYQSGNPYGEPGIFVDPHCRATGTPPPGCIPNPGGLARNNIGPDPYTKTFDSIGALKGPSWWTMNLAVAHDLGHNVKATVLATNLIQVVHNQGYPWEQPTHQNVISYSDNTFYKIFQLGEAGFVLPNPITTYYGDNYYPYSPSSALPVREYVFSLSTKI